MECRIPVIALLPSRQLRRLGMLLLLCSAFPAFAADQVVLIVSANSPVSSLNILEIHKLFLGLTVNVNGTALRPLRNESDQSTRQIFYQNIVSMSETVYERRVLAQTLQNGRTAPPIFRTSEALMNAVAGDFYAVSYAWAAEASIDKRVRILRNLGRE